MRLFRRITAVTLSVMTAIALLAPVSYTQAQTARDCDDNAIIRCGVGSLSELKQKYRENQAGNVTTIFQHFGIGSEGAMDGMVSGRVTRSNEVFVGDDLVATNAVTAGRQNMSGSTPILGGIAYERPPSVSFNSTSLPALVKMEAGRFKFAVIMSCGNAVKATPRPPAEQPPATPPSISIRKDVRAQGQTEWQDSVRLENNRASEFRIIVKNTGKVVINNFVVGDKLPAGMTIEAGSVTLNGQPSANSSGLTQNGITINQPLQPNAEITITFKATIATAQANSQNNATQVNSTSGSTNSDRRSGANDQECKTHRYRNVAFVRVPNLPEKEDDATVTTETCEDKPQPVPPARTVGTEPTPTPPAPQPAPVPSAPLPATGSASLMGIVTITSMLGAVAHKLKDFYLVILNK